MSSDLKATLAEVGRNCFCLHARMAARAVTRQYNAALAPLGLEVTEFSLLGSLAADHAASIAELADRLAFERTTLEPGPATSGEAHAVYAITRSRPSALAW